MTWDPSPLCVVLIALPLLWSLLVLGVQLIDHGVGQLNLLDLGSCLVNRLLWLVCCLLGLIDCLLGLISWHEEDFQWSL